ncbi:MAG: hypothetical protein IPM58_12150 [Nitrospira sp.]|nr:hypothetical protein [Nitrospira sp.]
MFKTICYRTAILLILIVVCVDDAQAAPVTPGNILAASWETGLLSEYTSSGTLVQTFSVPDVDGDGFHELRDVKVDSNNGVHLYNGTFDPYLTSLDPRSNSFQHHTFSGLSTVNNVSFGGLDTFGNVAFLTDMRTFGDGGADEAMGIVRFSLTDFSATRFATSEGYQDLTIGLNGLLYALPGEGTPASSIEVFDPTTLASVRTIPFPDDLFIADVRGIAVDQNGLIYAAGWDGNIFQVDGTGMIRRSVNTGISNLMDIDINPGGQILASGRFGEIILANANLVQQRAFTIEGGPSVHVAFAHPATPVPESSALVLTGLGLLGLIAFKMGRCGAVRAK